MFQKKVVAKIKTHFMFNNSPENHAVYELIWKNMVDPDRTKMEI
jgi:hypothetical protein